MRTLLLIHSSPMGEHSHTRQLGKHYAERWLAANPDARLIERDLAATAPPHLDADTIGAFYTPGEALDAAQRERLALSDELIAELESADEIVIGSPMHNFSISGLLKAWIDQVLRVGRTFRYTENGPVGLLKNRRVVVISARGGRYDAGSPAAAMNHQDGYLRTVLGFIGLHDVEEIHAEGVAGGGEGVQRASAELIELAQRRRAA